MTLTVPQAGIVAGRSASVRIEAPDTGQAIAAVGERMAQLGEKVKAERDAVTQQRVQLDMARDLARARQEVEQTSDPAVLGSEWEARSAAIRSQYIDQIKDPALKERLDIAFTEMNDRQSLAVGNRAIALAQSQREALWVDQRATITAEAARADEESFGILLELGEEAINTRLATGDIDPATAAKERQALRVDVYGARAAEAISTDPEAFIAAVNAGRYDILGDRVTDFRLSAEREIARRADAQAKEVEKARTAQIKALKTRLTDQAEIFGKGLTASDEALLKDPTIAAIAATDPEVKIAYDKALASKALRDEMPNIRQMTPAELRAAVAAERATPKDQPFQAERVAVLESWLGKMETEWQSDGVSAARAAGMAVNDLPEIDPADPSGFASALGERLAFDDWARKKGYTNTQAVLSGAEQARLKSVLDPAAPVGPKLALAQAVASSAGADSRRVTALMGADPVFNRALTILRDSGDQELAAQILTGQQKEKLGTVSLPPKTQRQLIWASVTGGALAANPAMEAEIFETASALYAAEAAGVNPDGENSVMPFKDDTEAQDLFASAIARVSGAKPDRNGDLTVGGLQEVNGAMVMLPKGVARDAVADAWDNVDRQLRGAVWDARNQTWSFAGEGADPLRALRAASIDAGAAPALGSNARSQWLNAQPRRVGETDVYELVVMRNGREVVVPIEGDEAGRAFRFRLPALIEGARQ